MKISKLIKILMISLIIFMQPTFVKAETRNNNPLLREILIDGETMNQEFDQFIADYVFATDKESINIQAIPDDPNAQVEIKGNTKLKDGNNDIEIKVTAEDKKTSKSYFLHITKGNKDLANANLKSLEVKGYGLNPAFNSKDVEYLITYEGSINNLNIEAIPENEKAAQLTGVFPFDEEYKDFDGISKRVPHGIGEVSTLEMRRMETLEEVAAWQKKRNFCFLYPSVSTMAWWMDEMLLNLYRT